MSFSVQQQKDLADLLELISGVSFVWSYPNFTRPDGTFLSATINNKGYMGEGERTFFTGVGDTKNEDIRFINEYMLYLQCNGENTDTILDNVAKSLRLQKNRDSLRAINLAYIMSTPVIPIPVEISDTFVTRHSADLLFRNMDSVTGEIYVMEDVVIGEL